MAKPIASTFKRQLRTAAGKSDSRKRLIGAIMAAANRLGLDDDARRDVYERATGQRSASNLNLGDLGRILDALNKDWKGPMGHRAHVGKIRALWWTLYWLGEVKCGEASVDRALDAFVARQAKVASLRFLDVRGAPAVIEALKAMAARAGVKWPPAPDGANLQTVAGEAAYPGDPRDAGMLDRHAVLDAIWLRLREAGAVQALHYAEYMAKALGLAVSHHHWTARELDAAIRMAGRKLRRAVRLPNGEDEGDDGPGYESLNDGLAG